MSIHWSGKMDKRRTSWFGYHNPKNYPRSSVLQLHILRDQGGGGAIECGKDAFTIILGMACTLLRYTDPEQQGGRRMFLGLTLTWIPLAKPISDDL